ncbi:MAG: signal peptidase I [Planctomycetota bacterium]|nr:signal peptidase I [Planctomycetota bacterium]
MDKNSKESEAANADTFWQIRWRRRLMWFGYALVALSIGWGLRPYTTYSVPQGAAHMSPEYPAGMTVLVNTSYRTPERLHRGDCVIYEVQEQGRTIRMIGRAVGWPGETAAVAEGMLLIGGQVMEESYLRRASVGACRPGAPVEVPPGGLYVLNDDRASGVKDGREYGPLKPEQIVGKVIVPIASP